MAGAGILPAVVIGAATLAGPNLARAFDPAPLTAPVGSVTGGAPNAAPATLASAAADLLTQTTAKGGSGYRFEIVQRSTLAGAQVGSLVETGFVTPAGFSMEMRAGPAPDATTVDLVDGDLLFRALVRDGKTYRDDGDGWYPTSEPPGIGLDPVTVAALPGLLRNAGQPADTTLATAEGDLGKTTADATRAIAATGAVADIPGVVAVDAAAFTALTKPVAMTFDAAGRLVGLLVTAKNTAFTASSLEVTTEITLHYDNIPQVLPLPEPAATEPNTTVVVK